MKKNKKKHNINEFFNPKFLNSKLKQTTSRTSLTMMFAVAAFVVVLSSLVIVISLILILVYTGAIPAGTDYEDEYAIVIIMLVTSIITGAAWALFFGRVFTKPVNQAINMMNRLVLGDFKARVKPTGHLARIPVVEEFTESINTMAEELDKTEILRSDFVNNFSHEFKTPIVSIAGFAKLLKEGDLSEEEKKEYINIIEEESLRLSDMATKVLELTKIENQSILSDVKLYNLSEQIRNCFLILESKWSEKELNLGLEFHEQNIVANEVLMKDVWLNLIDNAIKFTPFGGMVSAEIENKSHSVLIKIINTGSTISEQDKERIFNKFYQADVSHSTVGNGIGLAVVKKIVELHGGRISVESANDITSFVVELPQSEM